MTRILVTGADGFVGKNFVKALLQNDNKFEIHTISRKNNVNINKNQNINFVDLVNLNYLKQIVMNINPNIVVHLAYSKKRTENIYNTTLEIFDLAQKENITTHRAALNIAQARINARKKEQNS